MSEEATITAAPPAAAPAPAAPAPAPAAPAPAPTSALASGATAPAAAPAPAAPAPQEFKFAEKVVVKNGEAIDWEATARNSEKGRQHLETRLGSGDGPPATAADYKLNLSTELAEKVDPAELAKSADFKAMQTNLHALGLSQKQMDGVVSELIGQGLKMQAEAPIMAEAECVAALRQVDGWKSETEYKSKMGAAFRTVKAFAGSPENEQAILQRYGNDPLMCQVLAKIGAELTEDRQASPEAMAQVQESMDQLMNHPSYLNQNHPQHADTVAKVEALTARQVGNRPVGTGKTMSFKT